MNTRNSKHIFYIFFFSISKLTEVNLPTTAHFIEYVNLKKHNIWNIE